MIYHPWLQGSGWEERDPRLKQLTECPLKLPHLDDVIAQIPLSPGIFSVLGPRQVGKSTLLRLVAVEVLKKLSPQHVILLEGDSIETWRELVSTISEYVENLPPRDLRACILIDEITSVPQWHRAVKLLADSGRLEGVLLLYTGSSSTSLKEGGDLFPGRRGRHKKTDFELHPARYSHLAKRLSLEEYFTVGGFPWAVNEYLRLRIIPDYVGEIYWSWIKGEFLKRGKSEEILRHLVRALGVRIGTGLSHNALARDVGIASNDTARQYLELLQDCFAINEVFWTDPHRDIISPRKNRKYYPVDPFLIHLFRLSGSLTGLRAGDALGPELQGKIAEAVVCQELRCRSVEVGYWLGRREVDFILPSAIEVKFQSRVGPQEFLWFEHVFPKRKLVVLTKNDRFQTENVKGTPLGEWLLGEIS